MLFWYYYGVKKIIGLCCVLFVTSIAHAATMSLPENALVTLPIEDPSQAETYYGTMTGFPHTYEFVVREPLEFSALVSSAVGSNGGDSLSLIIVKEEKRGVSEVGRVRGDAATWTSVFDSALAVSMRQGTPLSATLETGVYRLEVSSPDNMIPYQLTLNGGGPTSYGELVTVRKTFNLGYLSILFAWRIYLPLLMLIAGFAVYRYKKKRYA